MALFELTLNGEARSVDVDAETPLLWVLRDTLQLTGTKYSCGVGLCGTCTVLVDGVATRSCATTIAAVAGKQVSTIEGLGGDDGHPLQQAWLDEEVSQCGYCQPGQLMTAAALLADNPTATGAEIDAAMSGVMCRCGTYKRIRRAIERVVEES